MNHRGCALHLEASLHGAHDGRFAHEHQREHEAERNEDDPEIERLRPQAGAVGDDPRGECRKRQTADLADHQAMVRRLEPLDLSKAPAELRREVDALTSSECHYERVRLLLVLSDRMLYETGFSPHVRFDGIRQLIGDPTRLDSFGSINWRETLQSWRILNDPDHAPVRLPGLVYVGGHDGDA